MDYTETTVALDRWAEDAVNGRARELRQQFLEHVDEGGVTAALYFAAEDVVAAEVEENWARDWREGQAVPAGPGPLRAS